jgi:hypothetical protein
VNDAVELPPLEGTADQVNWAERIRAEAAPAIAKWIAASSQYSTEGPRLMQGLLISKASFWIQARGCETKGDFLLQIQIWLRGTGPAVRQGVRYRRGAAARRGYF